MTQKNMYPRPDFERKEWKNLNGTWNFSFEEDIYDRKIQVPFPWGSPLSGINEKDKTRGFYRKTVSWNPKQEKIFLVFGAVDYTCKVYVNGSYAGSHKGGYSQFEFDVTKFWDRESKNTIEVVAEDKAKLSQTYGKQGYGNAKGIWQTVYLEARPASYVKWFKFTTALSGEISFEAETAGCKDGTKLSLSFEKHKASCTVRGNKATVSLNIRNPKLWSPESPYLYRGTISLLGKETDTVRTYFGIREIGTGNFGPGNVKYITLNGKPLFISAFLDQSFNPKGFFTLPSDRDCEEEILRVRKAGFNGIRIHIKAEEPLKLYYADLHGVLVMEDFPCFWSEATPSVRKQFEKEMTAQLKRDINHPATFYWIVFNETWGLFSEVKDENGQKSRKYTDETAKWVTDCFNYVKNFDPTRITEDNSVCNKDHTLTDVNTWHFYANGYETVKKIVSDFCSTNVPGSTDNYHSGFAMGDVPLMNSECGNYWGIEGCAGESDISWQYKYMVNEFRRNEKLCGYVFTEFHDVINEFNGFYKLNNDRKIFGYETFGSSLGYLNSQDYIGADYAPASVCRTGDKIVVPLFLSSFSDKYHNESLKIVWNLYYETSEENVTLEKGEYGLLNRFYGVSSAGCISFTAPSLNGPGTLSWALIHCSSGTVICSNYINFDFNPDEEPHSEYIVDPCSASPEGWLSVICHSLPGKISGLGSGRFSLDIDPQQIPEIWDCSSVEISFEASTRFPMTHDLSDKKQILGDMMLGYAVDPLENTNSFPQTDGSTFMGTVKVFLDNMEVANLKLPDCPADSRGFLSHFYQESDTKLTEAGSYGFLYNIKVPSSLFIEDILGRPALKKKVTLSFAAEGGSGLSLFGRKSGRYGRGIRIKGLSSQ